MTKHRSGCTEATYHKALQVELYRQGVCSISEIDCYMMNGPIPIRVGQLDMEVAHKVILELKVASKITLQHVQQLRRYVRARKSTGMNVEAACVVCFTEKEKVEFLELDVPRGSSPYFKLQRVGNEDAVAPNGKS